MSYKTPILTIAGLKGIDKKIQDIASHMADLTWLSYAFGLANRDVTFKDGKENVIPTAYQDLNSKDPISMMPSDLHKAFSFWVKEPEAKPDENNTRLQYKISCVFYCDLKQIDPNTNYAVTKSKIRQDVLKFFHTHENAGLGQLTITSIIDDDITQVYKGFTISQIDNKFRMLPKYAIRVNLDYSFLAECEGYSVFNMKYGLLYNWFAANDAKNIANIGWHVPTQAEINILAKYIDPLATGTGSTTEGGKLKIPGYDYFLSPNTGATNVYKFNGIGSGYRLVSGTYGNLQLIMTFRTSSLDGADTSFVGRLAYNSNSFSTAISIYHKSGISVRLIKDSTTLKHGQAGIYTGNDGRVYKTICIGTQEWMSENLAETKYRDGSSIPEVTDNTAWSNLVTGALCAYNNDWNNAL